MRSLALESQSVSADLASTAVSTRYVDLLAVQVNITAVSSPVATGKLQVSEDNSNWSDVDGSSFNISAIGTHSISVSDFAHRWVRASFAVTSGTFTAEVLIAGKERRS